MKPSEYKNIIFDFGGVILNIDYHRTISAFRALGIRDFEEAFSQAKQSDLFDLFERGEISNGVFRDRLRQAFSAPISDEVLDTAWNAMLLDLPVERLRFLEELRNEKRISLLSNTNEIHVKAFERELENCHGYQNLDPFFDHVYYSCRTGMRKPEKRIFEMVLEEQDYLPAETLFIDDSIQHIEGARKAGLQAYHLRTDEGETILDLF